MQKIINRSFSWFPTYGEKNIFWFYLISLFGNAWFQIGNWLIFVLFFMGEAEFALYEAVAFGAGILLEIPSGALADIFGKRRIVITGLFFQTVGSFLFIFGYLGNAYFFFGNLIIILSFALISGALEALVYDTLAESKKTSHFDEVLGKAHSINILSVIIAGLIGGIAWRYTIYAPLVLTAVSFLIAFVISFKLKEPMVDTEKFTIKNFILQNKKGFYYLFRSDFRKYTLSLVLITGSFLMWSTGIIRVLMGREFGYDGESLNYLISATLVFGFAASYFFGSIRKKLGDKIGFTALILMSAAAWIISGALSGSLILGALVFIAITISGSLAKVWSSVILNSHLQSKDRATAISTLSFVVQLPYVVIVVIYGGLVATNATSLFYIITGFLLLVGAASFWGAEKSKSSRPTSVNEKYLVDNSIE